MIYTNKKRKFTLNIKTSAEAVHLQKPLIYCNDHATLAKYDK
jgi:hypothetical protein